MSEPGWKLAGKKPAFWAVLIFVVLFVWGSLRDADAAEVNALVGVGFGATRSDGMVVQEVLLEVNEDWTFGVVRLGDSPVLEAAYAGVATRRVEWREGKAFEPFMSFGIAYFDSPPAALVNDQLTFALQAGFRWRDVIDLAWVHYSTAGRTDPNIGIDYVTLRAVLAIK